MNLTETQVVELQQVLLLFSFLKWAAIATVPIILAILRQVHQAIKYLQSISDSLQQISGELKDLKNKVDSLERDLGYTQIKVARRHKDE